MKKITLFLFTLCFTLSAWATVFTVNGVTYTITDATNNFVTIGNGNSAAISTSSNGVFTIPSSVSYNSVTYSVTTIGNYVFYNCTGVTSVTIPGSVSDIGYGAFYYCSGLKSVSMSNSVLLIEDYAFSNCSDLGSITIPNSVISIGQYAFDYCSALTSVTFDSQSSVNSIGNYAFEYCTGLTSFTIPDLVTSISLGTFAGDSRLTSVTIPGSVTSIGIYAFSACSNLNSVTIPGSVTSIGSSAFNYCTGLTSIYANNADPSLITLGSTVFSSVPTSTCILYVPTGSKSLYAAADQWKDFTQIVEKTTTASPTITNAILNVYPNPMTESFQISGFDGTALITLRDLNGKTLLAKQINSSEKFNINSFSKGIYMIEIKTNEGSILKKIVKN